MGCMADELKQLMDHDLVGEVLLAILAIVGFLLPLLVKSAVEGRTDYELPDEAYGLLTIAPAWYALDGGYRSATAGGGVVYIGHKFTNERMNVQARLEG